MQMIRVNSSAMESVGYDPASGRLRIQFKQGHSYDFCRVPLRIYEGLMRASSKGSYYSAYIRDRYHC